MYLLAGQLSNTASKASQALDQWELDLENMEKLIEDKKAKNEVTIGIETNYMKGHKRYIVFLSHLNASHEYVKALEAEINRLKSFEVELRSLQRKVKRAESHNRCTINDFY